MIVTAPFRCGATEYCLQEATKRNLRYVGEIDKQAIPFTTLLNKAKHHETGQQPWLTFDEINSIFEDHSDVVILNNTCNPALFANTEVFMTRRVLSKSYHSFATLLRRAYPSMTNSEIKPSFKRHSFQIGIMYSYMKKHNITPIYFEDLYPDSDTHHATYDDPEIVSMVTDQLEKLSQYDIHLS